MRFVARNDIAGGPSVALAYRWYSNLSDCCFHSTQHWRSCFTWPGAWIAALWRNLLGPLYVPFSPSDRLHLEFAKRGTAKCESIRDCGREFDNSPIG